LVLHLHKYLLLQKTYGRGKRIRNIFGALRILWPPPDVSAETITIRQRTCSMTTPEQSLPDPDFPQLMAQLRARLHRYCARMTGSALDGEDVVQETLIKANESFDASRIQNVEGWLFRIAHNAAMDFLRRRAREQSVFADEDVEAQADPGPGADQRHLAATALRTFMRLPPIPRGAVILCDVLGYALDEAAEVMAITVPAVKAALHRGRTRLRAISSLPDDAAPPALSAADQALLAGYAERFNARDFDGLRDMLGEDVRLDLVARRKPMQARGGEYFTRYAEATRALVATPMNLDGRPALWVDVARDEGPEAQGYVIVLQGLQGKVVSIKDFRYARYATEGVAHP
jgi:RNA polymerase sigma-70 factor (ECF subfamily)